MFCISALCSGAKTAMVAERGGASDGARHVRWSVLAAVKNQQLRYHEGSGQKHQLSYHEGNDQKHKLRYHEGNGQKHT